MGDTHLAIVIEKLKKFGATVEVVPVRIPYRETIKGRGEAQGKHKKQSGGRGQYEDCHLVLEPLPGDGFEFVDAIVGGSIPRQYIPAVEKGVHEAMTKWILSGSPVVGVKCSVVDGSYHDVDSSELAFKIAGLAAFKEAVKLADPALLEPIMKVEVITPEDFMGDVIGDLNSRRGQIQSMDERAGARVVKALVPLSEMFGYVGDLRSRTQGRASYSMEFDSYAEVPANVSKEIVAKVRGE